MLYSHAWGAARVTSDKDWNNPFPVDALHFTVVMLSPIGDQRDSKEGSNAWEVSADAKHGGTSPVFNEPKCQWLAQATHKGFGTWDNNSDW